MSSADRVGHLRHVNVAMGIHGNAMRRNELARPLALFVGPEAADQVALQIIDGDAVSQARGVIYAPHAVEFPHVDMLPPQHHRIGPMDIIPHGDEGALRIKELDAVSLAVHDIDLLVLVNGDIVRPDELAGINARAPPGKFVLACTRIHVDTGVAIAIGHVDVARARPDSGRRWPVERFAAPLVSRGVTFADFQHLVAVRGKLLDRMNAIVRHQQGTIMGDIQSMGTGAKVPLAEGAAVVALAVKHQDRVRTAGENVDSVLRINGDSDATRESKVPRYFKKVLSILQHSDWKAVIVMVHNHDERTCSPTLIA